MTAELLEFTLWYIFPAAIFIFLVGSTYRLLRYVFLYKRGAYACRKVPFGHLLSGLIWTFLRPIVFNLRWNAPSFIGGLLALHIVGLIFLVFLLGQHVAYLAYLFPPYGLLWPFALPLNPISPYLAYSTPQGGLVQEGTSIWGPLTIILNGDVLTAMALAGIIYKIVEKSYAKMKGALHVRWGDIIIWPLLLIIVVTGLLAAHHVFPEIEMYRFLLGLHIASAALFLALMPFTKLFHFVWNYWYGKLHEWYDLVVKRGA